MSDDGKLYVVTFLARCEGEERVVIGPFSSRNKADAYRQTCYDKDYEYDDIEALVIERPSVFLKRAEQYQNDE